MIRREEGTQIHRIKLQMVARMCRGHSNWAKIWGTGAGVFMPINIGEMALVHVKHEI